MEIQAWAELLSHAGVCVVLGIAVYVLWGKLNERDAYIRERDKEHISVLNHLTTILEQVRSLLLKGDV